MTHPREDKSANDDVQRVSREVSNRLEALGVWLSGAEKPEELVRIQESVERFELAVKTRGGDLMVDEGPNGQTIEPDDVHFALPPRHADESVARYLDRLDRAREEVLRHPPKD
jgi:hypothetical protein